MMPRPGTLGRLLRQTLIVLLITFALGEAVLRLYDYFQPLPIFYSANYNRWRGQPFAPDYDFHLNSRGFKDVEFTTEKPAGTHRILGLGDSFAFGVVPYAYNYLTLLEQRLNDRGQAVEVINMGIPAIGPEDYLSLLVREGLVLKPDRVLVSFFIGNDFSEGGGRARQLLTYTYFGTLIKYVIDLRTKFAGIVPHRGAQYDDQAATFIDATFLDMERYRSYIYIRENARFEHDFARTLALLVRMRDICAHNGIALSLVLIPDELQVDRALQRKVIEALNLSPEMLDFAMPNKRLAAALQQHGVDTLDLLRDFVATGAQERLYKPNDTHWNIRGNALAAELIARHLAREQENQAAARR